MTGRIANCFEKLHAQGRKAFISYIMGGDPNLEESRSLLLKLPSLGVDIIEIGFPFSDPMADGEIIQDAAIRAIESGVSPDDIFALVKEFRATYPQVPVIGMGYMNMVQLRGAEEFAKKAQIAGIDGFIIVDLPPEEDGELVAALDMHDISLIRLFTPTSDDDRLQKIARHASGFLYYVSTTGVTGSSIGAKEEITTQIERARKYTDLPIAIGFGVRTAEMAAQMSALADGVVVGSAIVKLANEQTMMSDNNAQNLEEFVGSLSQSVHEQKTVENHKK